MLFGVVSDAEGDVVVLDEASGSWVVPIGKSQTQTELWY